MVLVRIHGTMVSSMVVIIITIIITVTTNIITQVAISTLEIIEHFVMAVI